MQSYVRSSSIRPTRRRSCCRAANDPTLTCTGTPGAACNASNANFGKLSNGTATGRQIQFSIKVYY